MRRRLLSILVLALAGCATPDAPVGPWSRLPPANGDTYMESIRAEQCIPRISDIGLPIFPDAELVWIEWSRRVPHCDAADPQSPRQLEFIMMSTAPQEEVEQWYGLRLPAFRKYPAQMPGSNGRGVIFVKGAPADFSYARDIPHLSAPHVAVESTLMPYRQIGYRTVITFHR